MLHILLQQEQRRGNREEKGWYFASEIAVNYTALKSGFTLPGESDETLRGILPDNKTEGKSVEEIYDLLPPVIEIDIPVHVLCSEGGDADGNALQETSKRFINEKELKSIVSEAAAYARMYGRMPAGLDLFVDDLLIQKLPWRELLWRYVTQEFLSDYTWASPNRRYVQHGIYLPGVQREGLELVVCVDTSASVDQNTLAEFFAEIKSIATSYENVRVHLIECDATVTGVYEINDRNFNEIQFKGGGGTIFTSALEKASEFRPRVCVYLTDGSGEFPEEAPSFPVIWALTNREAQVPFGLAAIIE